MKLKKFALKSLKDSRYFPFSLILYTKQPHKNISDSICAETPATQLF